jgi:hypothetical protein
MHKESILVDLPFFSISDFYFEIQYITIHCSTNQWVSETLLAALSLMHHYAPRYEALS